MRRPTTRRALIDRATETPRLLQGRPLGAFKYRAGSREALHPNLAQGFHFLTNLMLVVDVPRTERWPS